VEDWHWKLREASERIKTRYEHIGRKTGAPFLGIVYAPEAQKAVLREWGVLTKALEDEYQFSRLDALELTNQAIKQWGAERFVQDMEQPFPGSDPQAEMAESWVQSIIKAIKDSQQRQSPNKKLIVSLERLSALYPLTGPRYLMQQLWDSAERLLEGPVVLLIPGTMQGARTYLFANQKSEFMYRGDLL